MCDPEGKCCYFINLRAGVITIACILLIGDSILLACMSIVTSTFSIGLQDTLHGSPWTITEVQLVMGLVYDILFSGAVSLDILLLVGAIKGRRRFICIWTWLYLVVYIITLLVTVLVVIAAFVCGPSLGFTVTAGCLVHVGVTLYFRLVVRSYYHELGEQNGEGDPVSTAAKV